MESTQTGHTAPPQLPLPTPAPALCGLVLYALINPFLQEYPDPELATPAGTQAAALAALRSEAWQGRAVFVAQAPKPPVEAHRLAYLVELHGEQDPLLGELIDNARSEHAAALAGAPLTPYRTGILLESSLAGAQVMQRVEAMWQDPTGGGAYFNWADRRVCEALLAIFAPAALAQWLGPLARLHVLNRNGEWHTLKGAVDETAFDEIHSYRRHALLSEALLTHTRLRPDVEQTRQIRAQRAISLSLTGWQRQHGRLAPNRHQQAWHGVMAAQAQKLQGPAEQAEFAQRWMQQADAAHLPLHSADSEAHGTHPR